MATTTAVITLSSTDLTSDTLSLSSTATLTKAGTATGLDQTSGLSRKYYGTAQTNTTLLAAADYTNAKAHKVYIKNLSSDDTHTVQVELGATNVVAGKLYGGDWSFLPWDGANDIDISTSDAAMTVEYMVIFEA